MNQVSKFFDGIRDEFKSVEQELSAVTSKLFGAPFLAQLQTTAQHILQSELGKAALADGEALLAQVEAGEISLETATVRLAQQVSQAARNAGVQLETSLSTMVAGAVFAKLGGVLAVKPPAPVAAPVTATPPASAPTTPEAPAVAESPAVGSGG